MRHIHNAIIITGAMGSGKTTLIQHLSEKGLKTIPEPARPILNEQRAIGGRGVPDHDPNLFAHLMLSRSIHNAKATMGQSDRPVLFDRGIPDMIAYAQLFNLDVRPFVEAATLYRYHDPVFITEDWPEIYCIDDERTMSYEDARAFGQTLISIYQDLHYTLIPIPKASVEERSEYILNKLRSFI